MTTFPFYSTEPTDLRRNALDLWPQVFGFARYLSGNEADAEDLCQEAFLRFFRIKRPIDSSRPLLPLLLTIVRNLACDEARRSQPDSLNAMPAALDGLAAPADADPAGHASAQEEKTALCDALDRLSPLWKSVLYLRDGLDFSYREIASVVERSEDTVRVTLHRARKKIRELLVNSIKSERRAQ